MQKFITVEISGQADPESEEFRQQWIDFWVEIQKALRKFEALKPIAPRLAPDAKMSVFPLTIEVGGD